MRRIDALKLALVLAAIAIWAWGVRTQDNVFMLVGVGFMLVALALRFVPRKPGS